MDSSKKKKKKRISWGGWEKVEALVANFAWIEATGSNSPSHYLPGKINHEDQTFFFPGYI